MAVLGLVGSSALAGAAPAAQAPGELPPVTISSATLHEGDTITIAGTGCVDPDTGSGSGLEVALVRPADFGRGGTQVRLPTVTVPVEDDGSFAGSGVVEQPLFPVGAQTGLLNCQERSSEANGSPPVFLSRPVDLQIVAPSLPSLTVQAGSTIDYTLPCTIAGGEYGFFSFSLSAPGLADVGFAVNGTFPPETSPQQGDQVTLAVPADAQPGTYDATATCSVSEGGTQAYFAGFSVTVTPATGAGGGGGVATTSTPPAATAEPAGAVPAAPVAGTPAYTG